MLTLEKIKEKPGIMKVLSNEYIEEIIKESEIEKWLDDDISVLTDRRIALIVVDVQNDFVSGTMALKHFILGEDPNDVVPAINRLTEYVNFNLIIFSRDLHPKDHCSFIIKEKVSTTKKCFIIEKDVTNKFPRHCVIGTNGADYVSELNLTPKCDKIVHCVKGTLSFRDDFSALMGIVAGEDDDASSRRRKKTVIDIIKNERIDFLFVCGFATDYCVLETCKDAKKIFPSKQVCLLIDASRGTAPFRPKVFKDLNIKMTTTDRLIKHVLTYGNNVPKSKRKFNQQSTSSAPNNRQKT